MDWDCLKCILDCLTVEGRYDICNLNLRSRFCAHLSDWNISMIVFQESAQKMMEGVAYDGIVVDGRRIFFEYR